MLKLFKKLKATDYVVLAFSTLLIVLQVWLDLRLPEYMKKITMLIVSPEATQKEIWLKGLEMLGIVLSSALSAALVGFMISRMSAGFSMRLRSDIFNKVESFSLEEIKKFSTASLITRTTNDVSQIQMFFAMGMQVIIKAPVMAIWAIVEMSKYSWQYSAAIGIAVAVMITTIAVCVSLALPKFKKMQTLTDNLNRVTRENLEGVRVVRAYNAEEFEGKKFEKANEEHTKTGLFTSRVMGLMSPMMQLVMSSVSLALYGICAAIINNTVDPMAKLSALTEINSMSIYAMQVISAFIMIAVIFVIFPRASVSARRINEVLDTTSNITDGSFAGNVTTEGKVEFKNVSFKYPDADEYVLEDISFTANKGETVAFIGSTGSGKSTLINLVPRFYDVSSGEILVDDVPIKDFKLDDLRNRIGYISQKAVMFSGTVKENLNLGDNKRQDATDEELYKTLETACSKDFVESMEGNLEANLNQGGTNLSGGQKQRLSIARALVRKPEILAFDDSFSALDYKTDKKLRENLKEEFSGVTKLIVAQRIGTIKDADKIIVLSDGKIAGIGKHKELLDTCEVYREIAESQLSEEEIKNELK